MNSLPSMLSSNEVLLRAVYPANRRPDFWKNGKLSSAALKDKKGLSVNRTYTRTLDQAICHLLKNLTGNVVSISQESCSIVSALVRYSPSVSNKYHCEIHGSSECKVLSPIQAKYIASQAKLVYSVSVTTTCD